ncbi:MAG: competence protein CoiA family protein [Aerococcus sp.]|nr:competence protein CoiA family protein [Aerococcus sp.]
MQQLTFHCPKCHRPVQLIQSIHKRPYFAHVVKERHAENESLWHQQNKRLLQVLLEQAGYTVALEVVQLAGERRADLWVTHPQQPTPIAFELQSSRLSAMEVSKRNSDYQKMGCRMFWLLNPQKDYYQLTVKHLTTLAPFVLELSGFGLVLPYWLESEERVVLTVLDTFGQCAGLLRMTLRDYLLLQTVSPLERDTPSSSFPITSTLTVQQQWRKQQQVLRHPTQYEHRLLQTLYEQRLLLVDIPTVFFGMTQACFYVNEPFWIVLSYAWLVQKKGNDEKFVSSLVTENKSVITSQQKLADIARQWAISKPRHASNSEAVATLQQYLHPRTFTYPYQTGYLSWLQDIVGIVNQFISIVPDS